MRHGSLESGIGGFDLAAEWMGWDNVFHCEINPFCRTVLKYYWPNAKSSSDVFGFSGYEWRGKLDVLTCGFPCQPFSLSGKGLGDKDDRFIWPENMRIIRESQPAYVVAENVPGLLSKHPLVFERVCADLEAEGYEVQPFNIPACAAEKDHQRGRIFFLAYNKSFGERRLSIQQRAERKESSNPYGPIEGAATITNASSGRLESAFEIHTGICKKAQSQKGQQTDWGERYGAFDHWVEAAYALCRVDDGVPTGLDTKTVSAAKWRKESIMAFGNSVAWEIPFEIFKAIEVYEAILHKIKA